MKNKIKSISAIITTAALTFPVLAIAQFRVDAGGGTNLQSGSIFGIIRSVMLWLLGLVGVVGVIGFAVAGILYLTAAGDEDRIATAKKAMTYSIVGVVVAIVGLVILQAAQALLGGSSTTF